MADFRLLPSDRILIVGRSGSGKSTLVRRLTVGYRHQVVIDSKHEETLPRGVIVTDLRAFCATYPQRSRRVVFRPDPDDARGEELDAVIRRVLAYGNTALVVHEGMWYATPGWIVPAYRRAIIAGRSIGVPVWSVVQRPVGVHNVILSEAVHTFVFDLLLEDDRRKVAGFVGPAALDRPRAEFGFGYYGPLTGGALVPCPPLEVARGSPDPLEPRHRNDHGDGRYLRGQGVDPSIQHSRPGRPRRRNLAG